MQERKFDFDFLASNKENQSIAFACMFDAAVPFEKQQLNISQGFFL